VKSSVDRPASRDAGHASHLAAGPIKNGPEEDGARESLSGADVAHPI